MGSRRKSRELALQALYDMDMSSDNPEKRLERFCENFNPSKKVIPFFKVLVEGVRVNRVEIDSLIENHSKNWKVSRMSLVDRNVMRMAVFEMLNCSDVPVKVSINEAIDIGKKFGTEESGAFINGILDSIHKDLRDQIDASKTGDDKEK